jgi:hypothetical protein
MPEETLKTSPVNNDREFVLKQLKRMVPALVAFTLATLLVKYYG